MRRIPNAPTLNSYFVPMILARCHRSDLVPFNIRYTVHDHTFLIALAQYDRPAALAVSVITQGEQTLCGQYQCVRSPSSHTCNFGRGISQRQRNRPRNKYHVGSFLIKIVTYRRKEAVILENKGTLFPTKLNSGPSDTALLKKN